MKILGVLPPHWDPFERHCSGKKLFLAQFLPLPYWGFIWRQIIYKFRSVWSEKWRTIYASTTQEVLPHHNCPGFNIEFAAKERYSRGLPLGCPKDWRAVMLTFSPRKWCLRGGSPIRCVRTSSTIRKTLWSRGKTIQNLFKGCLLNVKSIHAVSIACWKSL